MADFNRAIELDPSGNDYFAERAETYRLIDQGKKTAPPTWNRSWSTRDTGPIGTVLQTHLATGRTSPRLRQLALLRRLAVARLTVIGRAGS